MKIDVITLFPGMFEGPFSESILRRARERGLIKIGFVNPRDFAKDRHRTVDDRPYGGGAGMVLMAEPLCRAIKKARRRGSKVVYLSPKGRLFDQALARKLSREKHLVLVCGRYEGIDERVLEYVDLELSIGDYVLTGGEIPAMAVVDAVARLLPGVLSKTQSAERDSFESSRLEHPHYTRPAVWKGRKVPAVLLGGDHAKIERWRLEQSRKLTEKRRPDLLKDREQH